MPRSLLLGRRALRLLLRAEGALRLQLTKALQRSRDAAIFRLVIGLAQGIALFLLQKADESKAWPATQPMLYAPLLVCVLMVPLLPLAALSAMRRGSLLIWTAVATAVTILAPLRAMPSFSYLRPTMKPVMFCRNTSGIRRWAQSSTKCAPFTADSENRAGKASSACQACGRTSGPSGLLEVCRFGE